MFPVPQKSQAQESEKLKEETQWELTGLLVEVLPLPSRVREQSSGHIRELPSALYQPSEHKMATVPLCLPSFPQTSPEVHLNPEPYGKGNSGNPGSSPARLTSNQWCGKVNLFECLVHSHQGLQLHYLI